MTVTQQAAHWAATEGFTWPTAASAHMAALEADPRVTIAANGSWVGTEGGEVQ